MSFMGFMQSTGASIEDIRRDVMLRVQGRVTSITGPVIRAKGLEAVVGEQLDLWTSDDLLPVPAEVVGLDNDQVLLMCLGSTEGIGPGSVVSSRGSDPSVPVGDAVLGRIIDGMGRPIDGEALPFLDCRMSLRGRTPNPMERTRIRSPFSTGVRAIDSMLSIGIGQRMGIFAGAGVGKSTLLSMIARHSTADVCVVALVGERGREVREFVEDAITDANRPRTVVVAVTGDQAPLMRIRGALLAATITEYFRGKGANVLFLLDSLTRYAMALREVGLAAGELPAGKGYPPSVFVELARILERAGNDSAGTTTGIYTVLVEGDDMADPVADSTLALLDGHIVLSRDIANRGVYPAIDLLRSKSRVMSQVTDGKHRQNATRALSIMATYKQVEDLIRIGAYQPGSDKAVDQAISFVPLLEKMVTQELESGAEFEEAIAALEVLVAPFAQAKLEVKKK
jgi:FliI/YscN family ATPase